MLFINKSGLRIITPFLLISMAVLLLLMQNMLSTIIDPIFARIRFNESLGIRSAENMFILRMFYEGDLFNKLLGFGLGNNAYNNRISYSIAADIAINNWTYQSLLRLRHSHNFWLGRLYSGGLIGAGVVIIGIMHLLRRIIVCAQELRIKVMLSSYLLVYLVMLWYRWTATGGLLEMFVFLIVLASAEKEPGSDNQHRQQYWKDYALCSPNE
jgi:O-antigen ligase